MTPITPERFIELLVESKSCFVELYDETCKSYICHGITKDSNTTFFVRYGVGISHSIDLLYESPPRTLYDEFIEEWEDLDKIGYDPELDNCGLKRLIEEHKSYLESKPIKEV